MEENRTDRAILEQSERETDVLWGLHSSFPGFSAFSENVAISNGRSAITPHRLSATAPLHASNVAGFRGREHCHGHVLGALGFPFPLPIATLGLCRRASRKNGKRGGKEGQREKGGTQKRQGGVWRRKAEEIKSPLQREVVCYKTRGLTKADYSPPIRQATKR